MHAYEMHAYEMHAYEMHAHEMHAHEIHACQMLPGIPGLFLGAFLPFPRTLKQFLGISIAPQDQFRFGTCLGLGQARLWKLDWPNLDWPDLTWSDPNDTSMKGSQTIAT
jgi:hypothetical protein